MEDAERRGASCQSSAGSFWSSLVLNQHEQPGRSPDAGAGCVQIRAVTHRMPLRLEECFFVSLCRPGLWGGWMRQPVRIPGSTGFRYLPLWRVVCLIGVSELLQISTRHKRGCGAMVTRWYCCLSGQAGGLLWGSKYAVPCSFRSALPLTTCSGDTPQESDLTAASYAPFPILGSTVEFHSALNANWCTWRTNGVAQKFLQLGAVLCYSVCHIMLIGRSC